LQILSSTLLFTPIAGVSVEQPIGDGHTPLFRAAYLGNIKIVKVLLKLNGDPNKSCSSDECTPVHAACWSGNSHVIQKLIDAGTFS